MKDSNRGGRSLRELQRKLFNSRFVTISVLLHVVVVVTFGGTYLFKHYVEQEDFKAPGELVQTTLEKLPERPKDNTLNQPPGGPQGPTLITRKDDTGKIPPIDIVRPTNPPLFPMPPGSISPERGIVRGPEKFAPPPGNRPPLTMEQIKEIRKFTQWIDPTTRRPGTGIRDAKIDFTAYLAKYSGGDWASTNQISGDGKIVKGSLPNLLYLMSNLSRNRINASPNAEPLDLSSDEIFAKRPPFIFFTGHRDFVLTEKEVANLQKYIMLGGCIWGDSSLPGQRSRFDLAFRREMRRVISDADKEWKALDPRHPIFTNTRNQYYPEINKVPAGVNFYKEPVYALEFAGEVAVLYTANDYGDMWQIALDSQAKPDWSRDEKGNLIAMNQSIWDRQNTFYRNATLDPVFNSYKFGTNIVMHLITRWQDRLANVPVGL